MQNIWKRPNWLSPAGKEPSVLSFRLLYAPQPCCAEIQAKAVTFQNHVGSNIFCSWNHYEHSSAAGKHQLRNSWTSLSCSYLEEALNMGSITLTHREPNHCQNIYGTNSWSLVSIPKHWSKIACARSYFLIVLFLQASEQQKCRKVKNLGLRSGWMKKCLCLWTHLLIQSCTGTRVVCVSLVPLAAGGRNYLLQHM